MIDVLVGLYIIGVDNMGVDWIMIFIYFFGEIGFLLDVYVL